MPMHSFIVSALAISCGRKYFPLSNSSPTSLIAGSSCPCKTPQWGNCQPPALFFFVKSSAILRFPFSTASRTRSAACCCGVFVPAAFCRVAPSWTSVFPGWFAVTVLPSDACRLLPKQRFLFWHPPLPDVPLPDRKIRYNGYHCLLYLTKDPTQMQRRPKYPGSGFAIAIVSPDAIAIVRNALLTQLLSGRPNEIFESPQVVARPFLWQYRIVSTFPTPPVCSRRPSPPDRPQ